MSLSYTQGHNFWKERVNKEILSGKGGYFTRESFKSPYSTMSNMISAQKTQSFDEFRASVASLVETYRQAGTSEIVDSHQKSSEPVILLQAAGSLPPNHIKAARNSQQNESIKNGGTIEQTQSMSRPPSRGSLKSSHSLARLQKGAEHLIRPFTSSSKQTVRYSATSQSSKDRKYVKSYIEELEDLLRYEKLKRIRSEALLKKVKSRRQYPF